MGDQKEIITIKKALEKAMKYCAYQERSHFDVRQKLRSWGLDQGEADEVLSELVLENFLSESRFAEAYVRGKLRIKKWGKVKIRQGLEAKYVSEYCIKDALEKINEEEYYAIFYNELEKRIDSSPEPFSYKNKGKIAAYFIRRGWEANLVWTELKEIEKNYDK